MDKHGLRVAPLSLSPLSETRKKMVGHFFLGQTTRSENATAGRLLRSISSRALFRNEVPWLPEKKDPGA